MTTEPEERSARFDLAAARKSYEGAGLDEGELAASWWEQLERWMTDAAVAGVPEPNAMVLATSDSEGQPSTRTVLCKGLDARGIVLFTNYRSRKGRQLAGNRRASVTFPWVGLARQVTLLGPTERVSEAESDAYFASRPRGSQLGAWASLQSEVAAGREELVAQMNATEARFDGVEVPRPEHWGGIRLTPAEVEFWQGRPNRLHDRLRFVTGTDDAWTVQRFNP